MKYIILTLLLATTFLYAQEPLKIYYLDRDSLQTESAVYVKAVKEYEKVLKGWKNELDLLQAEVKRIQGLIDAGDNTQATKERLQKKQDKFEQRRQEILGEGGLADAKHAEMIDPLLDKTQKAIEEFVDENNVDIIFYSDTGEIFYMKESIMPKNLTGDIAERVDKK